MTNKKFDRNKTVRLATTGILTAIVVVFQFIGASIKFGTFSVSLVLIPIVIGAALGGKYDCSWNGTMHRANLHHVHRRFFKGRDPDPFRS